MLIEFSVENYLSFKDMVTLSLEASTEKGLRNNVIEAAQGSEFDLLKSVLLYGPNASGKSNLFKAMRFMNKFVLSSATDQKKDRTIPVTPFRLDESFKEKPSVFEVAFLSNGVHYLYGFSVTTDAVQEEWLYSYPHKRKRVLFERNVAKSDIKEQFIFGDNWKGERMRLAHMTRPNALFVSVASQFNHSIAKIVTDWFSEKLKSAVALPTGMSEDNFTKEICHENPDRKNEFLRMLKNADLGIEDFQIEKLEYSDSETNKEMPRRIIDAIIEELEIKPEEFYSFEIHTTRRGVDAKGDPISVAFAEKEESDGTLKYFALAGPLFHVLNEGCCLLADEMDSRLHPLLTRRIIELFHDEKVNFKGAQLVSAIYEISLLGEKDFFRRDQIWFMEKDDSGATRLYSAWDYKVRKNERLNKGYLAGRYGAIPFIEKLID
jgi:uncharacterized protein